jgi:hypothetical protein
MTASGFACLMALGSVSCEGAQCNDSVPEAEIHGSALGLSTGSQPNTSLTGPHGHDQNSSIINTVSRRGSSCPCERDLQK